MTPREYLDLMRALEADLAEKSVEDFYRLSRALLVKDERNLDKFDVVFAAAFKGVLSLSQAVEQADIPDEWLRKLAERYLSPEERAEIDKLGFEKLMETCANASPSRRSATRAARNGSGPAAHRPSAPMAITPRACVSARTAGGAAAR